MMPSALSIQNYVITTTIDLVYDLQKAREGGLFIIFLVYCDSSVTIAVAYFAW